MQIDKRQIYSLCHSKYGIKYMLLVPGIVRILPEKSSVLIALDVDISLNYVMSVNRINTNRLQ